MVELLTSAQMRAIERTAIEAGRVTGLTLMERAGAGVVDAIARTWPELSTGRAVVLCGPGNNGGDGFVIARLLAARGWQVEVLLFGTLERLPPDARHNAEAWDGPVAPLSAQAVQLAAPADLWVDALFGTGLTRPLEGAPAQAVELLAHARDRLGGRVVAVDIASGLCADSGRFLGPALRPDLTVSFHRAKCGHHVGDGPAGALQIADIGLTGAPADTAHLTDARDVPPKRAGHKYDHGHALILGGGPGRGGAARLAARAALRSGCGLVTLGCPPAALQENAARLDAVMLRPVAGATGLEALLGDARLNALCLGPGLGTGDATRAMVEQSLGRGRGCVLDADALTVFRDDPDTLFRALHPQAILTPHDGEFARLFPDIAAQLSAPATSGPAYSRLDAVHAAAERAGCTVLLKGPDTVIAAPDGRVAVNSAHYDRRVPWLATAGAGDVLAGLITGFIARGSTPMDAAKAASWLHVEAARRFGPGLTAEDLPEALPAALRALEG